MIREGFWYWEAEPDLPLPVEYVEPWNGQAAFLGSLTRVEQRAHSVICKGFSICRICKCVNGSREFRTFMAEWPEGFRHYIEVHNVKPSRMFIEAIIIMDHQL